MIALFDYDSIIYKSVYLAYDFKLLIKLFRKHHTKEAVTNEIIEIMMTRLANMGDYILIQMESDQLAKDNDIQIDWVEYFITVGQSLRKQKYSDYKSNRKKTNIDFWVQKVRERLLEADFCKMEYGHEADDIIAIRAAELGELNYIVVSLDKDMKQIAGLHYDYYSRPWKPADGVDSFGNRIKPKMKGYLLISESEARFNLWSQILSGDSGDGVDGIPGVGKVISERILKDAFTSDYTNDQYEQIVKAEYIKHFGINGEYEFEKAHYLIKLGIKNGK